MECFLKQIKKRGSHLIVQLSGFLPPSLHSMDSLSVGKVAAVAIAIFIGWRLLRPPARRQRRHPKRRVHASTGSAPHEQTGAELTTDQASSAAENFNLSVGKRIQQKLKDGRKVSCCLLGIILEQRSPEELQQQATVRSSVLSLLLEINKHCDLYLMERVLDDGSQERVMSALEASAMFEADGLAKHKVLFCSTENGRASFVRQLEPDWHIDTNIDIISQLARFIRYQLHISPMSCDRVAANIYNAPSLEHFFELS